MGFKSATQYDVEKLGDFFRLANDGDYAKVIFMYQSPKDVMLVDAHYINTNDYTGYVQCLGKKNGCPACLKQTRGKDGTVYNGIRIQTELFIPMYVLESTDTQFTGQPKIYFWDRTRSFQSVLDSSVFKSYPDPSKYVFQITRHGVPRDPATRYEIRAIATATKTYDEILKESDYPTILEHYEHICKGYSKDELERLLNDNAPGQLNPYTPGANIGFTPAPRVTVTEEDLPAVEAPTVDPTAYAGVADSVPAVPEATIEIPGADVLDSPDTSEPIEIGDTDDITIDF